MNMLKTPCSIKCPDTAYLHKMSSSANGNNLKWQLTTFPTPSVSKWSFCWRCCCKENWISFNEHCKQQHRSKHNFIDLELSNLD